MNSFHFVHRPDETGSTTRTTRRSKRVSAQNVEPANTGDKSTTSKLLDDPKQSDKGDIKEATSKKQDSTIQKERVEAKDDGKDITRAENKTEGATSSESISLSKSELERNVSKEATGSSEEVSTSSEEASNQAGRVTRSRVKR